MPSSAATSPSGRPRAATANERDNFNAWISTRTATEQNSENPQVLERTHALEALKATERQRETAVDALETRQTALRQDKTSRERDLASIQQAGEAGYRSAVRRLELRVFALRLLITLPLLLLAVWLFVRKRQSPRWPFVWGFILFALYTFFFELVPYLPSYGGYLRYLVGLALTVWAGNYAITALRRYLDAQKAAEQLPEPERRQDLGYEAAQIRLARKICPACERPFDTTDPTNNFYMNCGLLIFQPCPRCSTRQTTFSHFCRACGLPKHTALPKSFPRHPPLPSHPHPPPPPNHNRRRENRILGVTSRPLTTPPNPTTRTRRRALRRGRPAPHALHLAAFYSGSGDTASHVPVGVAELPPTAPYAVVCRPPSRIRTAPFSIPLTSTERRFCNVADPKNLAKRWFRAQIRALMHHKVMANRSLLNILRKNIQGGGGATQDSMEVPPGHATDRKDGHTEASHPAANTNAGRSHHGQIRMDKPPPKGRAIARRQGPNQRRPVKRTSSNTTEEPAQDGKSDSGSVSYASEGLF